MWWEHLASTANKFPVFKSVLLIVVITLHIKSLDLFILHNCSYAPLTNISPFSSLLCPWGPAFNSASMYLAPRISVTMQFFSFYVWLISFSTMSSGFIHIIANDKISFYTQLCVFLLKPQCRISFRIHKTWIHPGPSVDLWTQS